jgi:hypothetical protein
MNPVTSRTAPKAAMPATPPLVKDRLASWRPGILAQALRSGELRQVCSGIGIPHIYEYLRSSSYAPETPAIDEAIAAAHDPSPAIIKFGLDPAQPSALCAGTLTF